MLTMDKQLRDYWPGWETVRLIGRGSFGSVYEIRREIRGRTEHAALKVISIPQNESEIHELKVDGYDDESITQYFTDSREKIEDEYAMMADLKGHSNVVYCDDIRTVQKDNGFGWDIYIKMELLTPLKVYLSEQATDAQVVKLGMDICDALKLCGELGIVHRDIKPENIFVSRNGNYKLGDFGIAKTMEGTTGGTKTGTYDYMAPEVYNNRPYHTQADIYSLGLVMYWLLNNRTAPFLPTKGKKPTPSEKRIARDRRFSGEQIPAPKNGSEELKRIVLKACAFDPKDRYQSAREMREELVRLSGGYVPVPQPEVMPDPESVTDPVLEEEATFVSVFDNMVRKEVEEENTVGPVFSKMAETETEEKTVGPVFSKKAEKDTEERKAAIDSQLPAKDGRTKGTLHKEKRIRLLWSILLAVCLIIYCYLNNRYEGFLPLLVKAACVMTGALCSVRVWKGSTKLGHEEKAKSPQKKWIWSVVAIILIAGIGFALIGSCVKFLAQRNSKPQGTLAVGEIQILHDALYFDRVGDKIALTSNQNDPSWSTNNPSVASVDTDGVVTIIGSGEADIYAEWNGKTDACHITVDCLYPADLSAEIAEAESLLSVVDSYQEQYPVYSYQQLDELYRDYIEAGGHIESHSYPGTEIYRDQCAIVRCYYADWYYDLKVEYFDYMGQRIYDDCYTVIVDLGKYDSTKPTYFNWTTVDTHRYYYMLEYKGDTYYRFYNSDTNTMVKSVYGANYITDGVTRYITVLVDVNSKLTAIENNGDVLDNQEKYIVKVVAGEVHNVALYSDGTVKSSGLDYHGEGNVEDWCDIIDVCATEGLTVGLKRDGTVVAVGRNTDNQCNVSDWTDISAIAASGYNVIGVKRDGTVEAVGNNDYGQCNVDSWTGIVQADIGTTHSVGLRADGTVVATGDNEYGQCNVSEWTDIVSVKVAYLRTIGLKTDGTVVATGGNFDGECDVSSWTDIVAIDTDGNHTVGLRADGTVVATGFNSWESYEACDVSEWSDIIYVEVGYYRTIGLKSDGTIVVTGWNDRGQCDISGLSLQ